MHSVDYLRTPVIETMFKTVVDGLAAQGWRCSYDNGKPRYKNSEGLRCPIGHLIADEDYDPSLEDLSIRHIYRDRLVPIKGDPKHRELSLVFEMQFVHDSRACGDDELLRKEFKEIARKYRIRHPALID